MRAVIISGGAITDYDYIKAQIMSGDTIICADSGYNHAVKMGLE
jgi:thiamine pyrophosphokinase